MEATNMKTNPVEDDEEYVLLDLNGVCSHVDIPANAPYDLSGLDTQNPILVIDNKLKLIGEYQETIGTCFVFSESDGAPVLHEEMRPSEANIEKPTVDANQASPRQVKPIAHLHKILKFRREWPAPNKVAVWYRFSSINSFSTGSGIGVSIIGRSSVTEITTVKGKLLPPPNLYWQLLLP
ncbi:hypothetical protein AAC387_Pa02g3837 [Persea americana]